MVRRQHEETRIQPATVVVINYDGREHLEECLQSIQEADGPIQDVILVDDASTDGSVAFVQDQFPWVRVIRLAENQGPAAARNAGIESAATPWVCLLDNDIVVDKGWLIALVQAMAENRDAAVCSSRILVYERPGIIGGDGNEAHFVGMPTQRNAGRRVSDLLATEPRDVGATGGASLLIDKSRIEGMPCFDPDFFYNFEELDFCLRNRLAGRRCLVAPSSIVRHKYLTGGVAGLSSSEVRYSSRRAFYVFRNRWLVILKIYALRTIIVIAPALVLFELVTILFAVRKRVVKPYLRAWASVIKNRHRIREKRRAIQASRTVRDKDLLNAHPLTLGRATTEGVLEATLTSFLSAILENYWRVAWHLL